MWFIRSIEYRPTRQPLWSASSPGKQRKERGLFSFLFPRRVHLKSTGRNCWEGASLLTRDAEQSLKEEGVGTWPSEPTRRNRQRRKTWRIQEESGGKGRSSVLASSTLRSLTETFRVCSVCTYIPCMYPLRTTAGSGRREVVRGCHHNDDSEEQSEEGEQGSGRAHAKLNLRMVF